MCGSRPKMTGGSVKKILAGTKDVLYNIFMKNGYVYILASHKNGTLYVGTTSNLPKRVWEHKHHVVDGFSKRYQTTLLVYYEVFDMMPDAIAREKQLKKWNRAWKIEMIEKVNPNWDDLYETICC